MDTTTITCPKCQYAFPLNAAIEQPIIEKLKAKLEAEVVKKEVALNVREEELARQAEAVKTAQQSVQQQVNQKVADQTKKIAAEQEQKAKEMVGVQLRDMQGQLAEKDKKLKDAQQQELQLLKRKRELEEQRDAFELDKAKQIEAERENIREKATAAATEAAAIELRELQAKLAVKEQKLTEAQDAELKLRKEKVEFEEQKKGFELEVARKADEAKDAVRKEKDEEFRLKEAESNKKLEDMKQQIDELRRKAEQGSQQTQGEVLELDLEAALKRCFPDDEIEPVAKGVRGADVIQHVRDEMRRECGAILWESKRAKTWSDGWLDKLKEDKLAAKAQVAALMSVTMPKDVPTFECRGNVWITPPHLAVPLAAALRLTLIETAAVRAALEGRQDKMEVVYGYLSGPEFKGRVTAIVEAFKTMRDDLESEKRAVIKLWAKREKQLERVLVNTAGLHGDLAGMIGRPLPAIESLELLALPDGTGDGEET